MKYLKLFQALLVLSLAAPVLAEDLESLTATCDGCHGPAGASSDGDIPVIGGQSETSIEKALKQFRNWDRPCNRTGFRHGDTSRPDRNMCEISEPLDNQDILSLARHYSSQPFVPASQEFDQAKAMEGANLYTLYCNTCHPKGGGEGGYAGRLNGQWKPYLKSSIAQISTGERRVPHIMARKLSSFSEQEISALLDFFASQQD